MPHLGCSRHVSWTNNLSINPTFIKSRILHWLCMWHACVCIFASCAFVSANVHGCGDRAEVDTTPPSSLLRTAHLCSVRSHLRERQGLYLGIAADFIVHLVEVTVAKSKHDAMQLVLSAWVIMRTSLTDSHCARSYGRKSQRKTGQGFSCLSPVPPRSNS